MFWYLTADFILGIIFNCHLQCNEKYNKLGKLFGLQMVFQSQQIAVETKLKNIICKTHKTRITCKIWTPSKLSESIFVSQGWWNLKIVKSRNLTQLFKFRSKFCMWTPFLIRSNSYISGGVITEKLILLSVWTSPFEISKTKVWFEDL